VAPTVRHGVDAVRVLALDEFAHRVAMRSKNARPPPMWTGLAPSATAHATAALPSGHPLLCSAARVPRRSTAPRLRFAHVLWHEFIRIWYHALVTLAVTSKSQRACSA
jgi:hypothetical protein